MEEEKEGITLTPAELFVDLVNEKGGKAELKGKTYVFIDKQPLPLKSLFEGPVHLEWDIPSQKPQISTTSSHYNLERATEYLHQLAIACGILAEFEREVMLLGKKE